MTMHNLLLTEDQTMILDTVRKFVQDAVAPGAIERDEHRQFASSEWQGLCELGLCGLPVPEAGGGAGMGLLPLVAVCEEIGAVSGSLARLLTTQVQCALALAAAGQGPLDAVVNGSQLAVYVGPEHGASHADGRLTGTCALLPGGGAAGLLVVAARRGTAPVLCLCEGAAVERQPLRSLGLASSGACKVAFQATAATELAADAVAQRAIAAADLAGLLASAATCIGLGRGAIALARRHAGERIAFGKPLLAQQAVVRKLVEGQRAIDAARHLAYHAARLADAGEDATAAALAARVAAADAAGLATDEGIQIHGGFGYTVEYHVERHYRDSRTIDVLDGGSDSMRDRLAKLHFGG
jgi:alkylation response protein AidB-like acyl-CoA dehydrogenase